MRFDRHPIAASDRSEVAWEFASGTWPALPGRPWEFLGVTRSQSDG
jgi:hypothetical protein